MENIISYFNNVLNKYQYAEKIYMKKILQL